MDTDAINSGQAYREKIYQSLQEKIQQQGTRLTEMQLTLAFEATLLTEAETC